jgi:hypothetical protein
MIQMALFHDAVIPFRSISVAFLFLFLEDFLGRRGGNFSDLGSRPTASLHPRKKNPLVH